MGVYHFWQGRSPGDLTENDLSKHESYISLIKLKDSSLSEPKQPGVTFTAFNPTKLRGPEIELLMRQWKVSTIFVIADDQSLDANLVNILQNLTQHWQSNGQEFPYLFIVGKANLPNEIDWPVTARFDNSIQGIASALKKILDIIEAPYPRSIVS
jgi:hypothetical protein